MKWPIIGDIVELATSWIKGKQRIQEAKTVAHENRLTSQQEHDNNWEVTAEKGKDVWLRRFSFAQFSAPFFIAIFYPEKVRIYFEQSITAVPEWWQSMYVTIVGVVWGVAGLKNALPPLLYHARKAWRKAKGSDQDD